MDNSPQNSPSDNTPNSGQNQPGRGIGKGMWIAFWLVGLGLLTLFFGEQEQQWHNPNQNPAAQAGANGLQEVVLQRNRQGHYITTGKINGKAVDMLLDTGATDVVVPAAMESRLGLKRGFSGLANTANGQVRVYATRIARLQIGNIILYDVPASINPSMDGDLLLGMSALKQVEFTQRDGTLTLRYFPNQ